MHIYKVWQERIASGVFTKAQCQQFAAAISRQVQDLPPHGKKTNLSEDMCHVLYNLLQQRGGVRLTEEHTGQGLEWLRRYGCKELGMSEELHNRIVDDFSHFLFTGEIREHYRSSYGYVQTCIMWRIVLTDGTIIDYWNTAWQGNSQASGYEIVSQPVGVAV